MKAKRIKGTDPSAPLSENAARIIKVRLAELQGFLPAALKFEEAAAQHDLRIAAKRLRYVLETTAFCFGEAGDTARKRAKDLQDVLGEMHDVDVMLPRLDEHRGRVRDADIAAVHEAANGARDLEPDHAGRAPHRTAYRGLEVLEVYLRARRRVLFDRFSDSWRRIEKRGVWRDLERAAEAELEAARQRRQAEEEALRARQELAEAERIEREAAERAARAAAQLAEAERRRR